MRSIITALFSILLAASNFAQVADVFVKGDSYQCWLDTREIVHRHGSLVVEDEKNRVIHAGHYSSMVGDFTIVIQVLPDKNKKGEEGCRVYVATFALLSNSAPMMLATRKLKLPETAISTFALRASSGPSWKA